MLSFNDFLKVFDAYGKYISQSLAAPAAPAAPTAPVAPTAPAAPTAPVAPTAPAAPAAQDGIAQMLTQPQAQPQAQPQVQPQAQPDPLTAALAGIQASLDKMQVPAPSSNPQPVTIDDIIAKI